MIKENTYEANRYFKNFSNFKLKKKLLKEKQEKCDGRILSNGYFYIATKIEQDIKNKEYFIGCTNSLIKHLCYLKNNFNLNVEFLYTVRINHCQLWTEIIKNELKNCNFDKETLITIAKFFSNIQSFDKNGPKSKI